LNYLPSTAALQRNDGATDGNATQTINKKENTMSTLSTLKTLSLSLFALPMLVACGQAEDAVDEALLSQDDIGTTQSALCTDAGAADFSAALIMGDVGGSVFQTSPTRTYGSALCSGNFVVEATGTAGKPNLVASAEYADTLPGTCSTAKISLEAFGFVAASNSWVSLGVKTASGQLVPSPFGGPSSCQVGAGIPVVGSYSKIRVAARAYDQVLGGRPSPRKVSGIISAHY
jgi:hypothetical protein